MKIALTKRETEMLESVGEILDMIHRVTGDTVSIDDAVSRYGHELRSGTDEEVRGPSEEDAAVG